MPFLLAFPLMVLYVVYQFGGGKEMIDNILRITRSQPPKRVHKIDPRLQQYLDSRKD